MMAVFTFIDDITALKLLVQGQNNAELSRKLDSALQDESITLNADQLLNGMKDIVLDAASCQKFLRGSVLDVMTQIGWVPGTPTLEFNLRQRAAITNLVRLFASSQVVEDLDSRYLKHKKTFMAYNGVELRLTHKEFLKGCTKGKYDRTTKLVDEVDDTPDPKLMLHVFDRMNQGDMSKSSSDKPQTVSDATITLVDKPQEVVYGSLIGTAMSFINKGLSGAALKYREMPEDKIIVPIDSDAKSLKAKLINAYNNLRKSNSPIKFELDLDKVNEVKLGSIQALKLYLESTNKVQRTTGLFCLEPEVAVVIMVKLVEDTSKATWVIGKDKLDCDSAFPDGGSIYAPEAACVNVSEYKRKNIDGKTEDVPWSADMGKAVIKMYQFFHQMGMLSVTGVNVRLGRFCLYINEDQYGIVRKMYNDAHTIQDLIHDDLVVGTLVRFKQDGKEYRKQSKHSICAGPWRAVIPHITAVPPTYHPFTALSSFMFTIADLFDIYLVGKIASRNLLFSFVDKSAVRLDINATRSLTDLDGDWKIETRVSGVGVIKFAPKCPKQ